ncbi:glycosyltransferase family 39 protein [Thermococcus sp.]|uniref:ArnT family glycosyltransferase n=1 Tax=Thermococcus sp. TaxID=35749 RepID=UPI002624FEDB|nr:glycosyltransferase family 39 protein [Thermococcus sp.]
MNEYVDYDEGTYLLIARLINHGYLPYRDIFAVHPPLYYYLLAAWLRIFGDSYITGRLLSVLLGAFSVIISYFTGKKVGGIKGAILYSGLLVLDPTMLFINRLVLHDALIGLFTVLSLYYFIKYISEGKSKHMYISLAIAGVGSTAKFTIIPFVVSLFVTFMLMSLDSSLYMGVKRRVHALLSPKNLDLIFIIYLILGAFFVSLRMAWPSFWTGRVLVLLGIHPFTLIGHKYIGAMIFLIWTFLFVYIFRVQYIQWTIRTLRDLLPRKRIIVYMALSVLLPKFIIEGLLGYAVSRSYLDQTYLLQGARFYSFSGLFKLTASLLQDFEGNSQELAYRFVLILALVGVIVFFNLMGKKPSYSPFRDHLSLLFTINFFMYLLFFPILPNTRFILSLFIVFYLLMSDYLTHLDLSPKMAIATGLVMILVGGMTTYGYLFNVPQGKLAIAWSPHSKDLREDAVEFFNSNPNLSCNSIYSVNPMNTYYFRLYTPPWYVDSFGWLYVSGHSVGSFVRFLRQNVKCVVFSTWMYGVIRSGGYLGNIYSSLEKDVITNSTLVFSGSYSTGDTLSVFEFSDEGSNFSLISLGGEINIINSSGVSILKFYPLWNGIPFKAKTLIEATQRNRFKVISFSNSSKPLRFFIRVDRSQFRVSSDLFHGWMLISFYGIPVDAKGDILLPGSSTYKVLIYTRRYKIEITAAMIRLTSNATLKALITPSTPVVITVS